MEANITKDINAKKKPHSNCDHYKKLQENIFKWYKILKFMCFNYTQQKIIGEKWKWHKPLFIFIFHFLEMKIYTIFCLRTILSKHLLPI